MVSQLIRQRAQFARRGAVNPLLRVPLNVSNPCVDGNATSRSTRAHVLHVSYSASSLHVSSRAAARQPIQQFFYWVFYSFFPNESAHPLQ